MTETPNGSGLDDDDRVTAAGRLLTRWLPLHRIFFFGVNGALTIANVITGPPWWALWPLLVTGAFFVPHWLAASAMKVDEAWADARAERIQDRSYDHSHIEDIIERRAGVRQHQPAEGRAGNERAGRGPNRAI